MFQVHFHSISRAQLEKRGCAAVGKALSVFGGANPTPWHSAAPSPTPTPALGAARGPEQITEPKQSCPTSSRSVSPLGPCTTWQTARKIPSVCSVAVTWCSNYLVVPSDMSSGDRTRLQDQKSNDGSTWPPGFNRCFVKSLTHKP